MKISPNRDIRPLCTKSKLIKAMTCFVQNQQKITERTMFFMSKQVSLPKISLIQQKYENQPK